MWYNNKVLQYHKNGETGELLPKNLYSGHAIRLLMLAVRERSIIVFCLFSIWDAQIHSNSHSSLLPALYPKKKSLSSHAIA